MAEKKGLQVVLGIAPWWAVCKASALRTVLLLWHPRVELCAPHGLSLTDRRAGDWGIAGHSGDWEGRELRATAGTLGGVTRLTRSRGERGRNQLSVQTGTWLGALARAREHPVRVSPR